LNDRINIRNEEISVTLKEKDTEYSKLNAKYEYDIAILNEKAK